MHKRGNKFVTLIHDLELTINVSCTAWNVKYFQASRSDVTSERNGSMYLLPMYIFKKSHTQQPAA